jgi:capsular polysaccharide transport system permease protein
MSSPVRLPNHPPWVIRSVVLGALLRQQMNLRFGEYRIGFFWMLVEPLLGVIIIGLLIGPYIKGRYVPEIPLAYFLLNGMLIFKLFTGPMASGIKSIDSFKTFLVYRSVKPLDTLLASFLYDLCTQFFSFTLFCVVASSLGYGVSLARLDVVLACFLLTWLMGCGIGLIFGVITAHFIEFGKIIRVITRPLVFVSGVLHPLAKLPNEIQYYLMFNPLVHTIEMSRHAFFPHYAIDGPNFFYPSVFAIIVLSLGLTLFHGNRSFLSQP